MGYQILKPKFEPEGSLFRYIYIIDIRLYLLFLDFFVFFVYIFLRLYSNAHHGALPDGLAWLPEGTTTAGFLKAFMTLFMEVMCAFISTVLVFCFGL